MDCQDIKRRACWKSSVRSVQHLLAGHDIYNDTKPYIFSLIDPEVKETDLFQYYWPELFFETKKDKIDTFTREEHFPGPICGPKCLRKYLFKIPCKMMCAAYLLILFDLVPFGQPNIIQCQCKDCYEHIRPLIQDMSDWLSRWYSRLPQATPEDKGRWATYTTRIAKFEQQYASFQ